MTIIINNKEAADAIEAALKEQADKLAAQEMAIRAEQNRIAREAADKKATEEAIIIADLATKAEQDAEEL
jgi:hypothetical protein